MATLTQVSELVAQLGGLAIFAGTLAAVAAFVYRWYVREEIPRGLALLVGLSGVAVYLNTTTALGQVIGGSSAPTEIEVALFNIAAFLVGAGGATVGQWAGDQSGSELFLGEGLTDVESDVGRLVQSVGRVIAVELPADIDDVVGYDPVSAETRETLAGKTFLFPRRLTVDELETRLVARLKTDYGVGHVDLELAEDGTVEYLALGSRAAGIGPTLPPATNAVAIRADPAFAASAGDLVQVWETNPMRRVLTAELRGVAGDTVTIAIDAADTQKIDPTTEYRLVTLPVEDRPDREFASLLRAADETFSSVTVEAGSPLHGLPVAALDLSVVAVKPESGTPNALPDPSTVLAPGDVVFAIARPDALRRLEVAATPLDPALVSEPTPPPQRSRQTDATATTDDDNETSADDATSEDVPSQPDADGDSAPATTGDDTVESAETATASDSDADQASESDDGDDEAGASDFDPAAAEDSDESTDFDPPAAEDTDDATEADEAAAGAVGDSSFQQLKEEFESGDADWVEGDATNGGQSAATAESDDTSESTQAADSSADESPTDDDGLGDALADAGADLAGGDGDQNEPDSEGDDLDDLGFGDESDGGDGLADDDALDFGGDSEPAGDESDPDEMSFDDEDDLSSLGFDEEEADDDLSSLSFDDEETEGLSLDDEDVADEDEDGGNDDDDEQNGDDEDEDEDEDEDDSGGGGAASFQQLKEEFESGDADWEDDISDSPGGDMRLDE